MQEAYKGSKYRIFLSVALELFASLNHNLAKMFKIVLDQPPNETVTCGSEVSGNLEVSGWEHPSTRARISIHLYGHVKVFWQESVINKNPDGSKSEQKLSYIEELNFLKLESPLFRSKLEYNMEIPFRFILPEDKPMPSPHDGYVGSIKYYVEALVHIVNVTDVGLVAPLSVKAVVPFIETVDINSPAMLAPIVRQQEEHIYHWYSKKPSGTVTVTVETPHTGYHLGESVPFTATVKNDTGSQVKMEAILLQTVSYRALGACKVYSFVLVNYPEVQMLPKITSVWSPTGVRNRGYEITKTELVSSTCLEYIKIQHQLEVTASLPTNKTLKFAIPITIGNVPRTETSATASAPSCEKLQLSPALQQHQKPEASPEVGWSRDLTSFNHPNAPSPTSQENIPLLPRADLSTSTDGIFQALGETSSQSQSQRGYFGITTHTADLSLNEPSNLPGNTLGQSPPHKMDPVPPPTYDAAVTSTRKRSTGSFQSGPESQKPTELTTEAPPSYEAAVGTPID